MSTRKIQIVIAGFIFALLLIPFHATHIRGDIAPIAFSGQPAPGTAGGRFMNVGVGGSSINAFGDMAFAATMDVQGVPGAGIYRISGGQLIPVALSGQPLPDGSGRAYGLNIGNPQLNNSGDIVFTANFASGQSVMSGVFLFSGGNLSKVLDTSMTAPGSSGQLFSGFGPPQINDNDDIALVASVGSSNGAGVFLMTQGNIVPVTLQSRAYAPVSLNNRDEIVFMTPTGISLYSSGTVTPIVTDGQSVPGTNLVVLGGSVGSADPVINDGGDVAFLNFILTPEGRANTPTPEANAILRWSNGSLQKVAAVGDAVPGISGATFGFSFFQAPQINQSSILFASRTAPAPGQDSLDIISRYQNGQLSVVARSDEVVNGLGQLSSFGVPTFDNRQGQMVVFDGFADPFDTSPAVPTGVYSAQSGAIYTLVFPQVADGSANGTGWRTSVTLANQTANASSATVNFYDDTGAPMVVSVGGQQQTQIGATVPASGVVQFQTDGTGGLKTGWARVQSDQMLTGILLYTSSDASGNLSGEVGVQPAVPLRALSLFTQSGSSTATGMAFANPSTTAASVTLTLKDANSNTITQTSVTIPAMGHLARYMSEIFGNVPAGEFTGKIDVVSTLPIASITLRQHGQVFTSLPIIP